MDDKLSLRDQNSIYAFFTTIGGVEYQYIIETGCYIRIDIQVLIMLSLASLFATNVDC